MKNGETCDHSRLKEQSSDEIGKRDRYTISDWNSKEDIF